MFARAERTKPVYRPDRPVAGLFTPDFREMYKNRHIMEDKEFKICVPSLEHLRLTKLLRNLPKDQEDLKYIDALLEERRRSPKKK